MRERPGLAHPSATMSALVGALTIVLVMITSSYAAAKKPEPFSRVRALARVNTGLAVPKYPLKASANGRYLVDQNNVPFLIMGDSPQGFMALSPADQQTYLSSRSQAGVNAIWVSLLCTTYGSICPSFNGYGNVVPFTTQGDLSTPNATYFAQVDAMLSLAAQFNIVVFLDPIETGGWLGTLRSNGATKDYNYGVYLGNRYKNFPNIVWLNGNDFQTWMNPSDDAVVSAVDRGIKSVDGSHLQTVELNYYTSGSLDDPTWGSIIGLDSAYSYYPTYAQVLKEYNRAHMPVWFIEGVYEYQGVSGGYLGPYQLRNQEYWTQLSGATGQLYGNFDLYGFPAGWKSSSWQNSLGITQFTYARDFFAALPWYDLVPDQNHSVVTAGYGTFQKCCINANSDYLTAARTSDGKLVVAYMPSVRTITVNMSKLTGPATGRWYDPTNGTYATISGSPFANSGSRQFTPPGKNSSGDGDWVLELKVDSGAVRLRSSGLYDGWVLESAESSGVGGSKNSTYSSFKLGDSSKRQQYRAILSFRTALPAGAVITSATLMIKRSGLVGKNPYLTLGNIAGDIRTGAYSDILGLQIQDFQAPADGKAVLTIPSTAVNNWYSGTIDPSALSYINTAGVTQFRLRFQIADNNDGVADDLKFYSGNAIAANRPVLAIQYAMPAP